MKTNTNSILLTVLAALLLTLVNCDKEEPRKEATLSTLSVTNITSTSAQSGGNITSDSGDDITSRGVVWSTLRYPTTKKNSGITVDGNGTGLFQSNITNLQPNTTYYLRAYATNEAGIAYGQQEEFITEVYSDGVTDIEGNFYPSVIIGNQEWMAENLKTTKYSNGTPIVYPGTDNSAWQNNTTGAYAWYDNDIAWKDSYGALYNWHAVNNSNGLCPTGWHVPSHYEWTQLEQYICNLLGNENCETKFPYNNSTIGDRGTNEGNALKSCWQVSSHLGGDCATSEHPRWNSHPTNYGTDRFSFSALPGSNRNSFSYYYILGVYGHWWSSTESATPFAWNRGLYYGYGSVSRRETSKGGGFSVRCVRNID